MQKKIEQWILSSTKPEHPSLNTLELPYHAKIIAGARCASGGLGLPINEPDTAPIAILCATLSSIYTLRGIYTEAYLDGHLLLSIMKAFLSTTDLPSEYFPFKEDLIKAKEKYIQIMDLPQDTTLEDLVANAGTIQSHIT